MAHPSGAPPNDDARSMQIHSLTLQRNNMGPGNGVYNQSSDIHTLDEMMTRVRGCA